MTDTIQEFEVKILAVGPSSGRYRRYAPEIPMPSPGASEALDKAVGEFQATLAAHGFTVARTGYGVAGIKEVERP